MFNRGKTVRFNLQISLLYLENIDLLDRKSTYSITWKRGRKKKNSGTTNYASYPMNKNVLEFNEYVLLVCTLKLSKNGGFCAKNITIKLKNRKKKTIGKTIFNLADLLKPPPKRNVENHSINDEDEEEDEGEGEDDPGPILSTHQPLSMSMKRDTTIPILLKGRKYRGKFCPLRISVNFSTLTSTSSDASTSSEAATDFSEPDDDFEPDEDFLNSSDDEKERELFLKVGREEDSNFENQRLRSKIKEMHRVIINLKKQRDIQQKRQERKTKVIRSSSSSENMNIKTTTTKEEEEDSKLLLFQNRKKMLFSSSENSLILFKKHSSQIDQNIQTARYKLRKEKHDLKIIRNQIHKKLEDLESVDKLLAKTFAQNKKFQKMMFEKIQIIEQQQPSKEEDLRIEKSEEIDKIIDWKNEKTELKSFEDTKMLILKEWKFLQILVDNKKQLNIPKHILKKLKKIEKNEEDEEISYSSKLYDLLLYIYQQQQKEDNIEKLKLDFEFLFREYVDHLQVYIERYPEILEKVILKCILYDEFQKNNICNNNKQEEQDEYEFTFSDDDEEDNNKQSGVCLNLKKMFIDQLRRSIVEIFSIYSDGQLMFSKKNSEKLQNDLTLQLIELERTVFRALNVFERLVFPALPSDWKAREEVIRNIFFSTNNWLKYRTFQMTILEVRNNNQNSKRRSSIEWEMLLLYKWMRDTYPRLFKKYYDQFHFFRFSKEDIHNSNKEEETEETIEDKSIMIDVQQMIMSNLKDTYISNCSKKLLYWTRHIVKKNLLTITNNTTILKSSEGCTYTKGPEELFNLYKQVTDEVIQLQLGEILQIVLIKFQGVVLEYAQKIFSDLKKKLARSYSQFIGKTCDIKNKKKKKKNSDLFFKRGIVFFSVEEYIPIVNDYLNMSRYLVEQRGFILKEIVVEPQNKKKKKNRNLLIVEEKYLEWMNVQTPSLLERMSGDCFREIRAKVMDVMDNLMISHWFVHQNQQQQHGQGTKIIVKQMLRFCDELDTMEILNAGEKLQEQIEERVLITYLKKLFKSGATTGIKKFHQKWVEVLREDRNLFRKARKEYASGSEKVNSYYDAVDLLLQLGSGCEGEDLQTMFFQVMGQILKKFPDFQRECALDLVGRSVCFKKNRKKWVMVVNKLVPDEKRVVLNRTMFSRIKFF